MKRLTRYVLFELLAVFMLTLTGLTLLSILAFVAKVGVQEGLGLAPMARLIPFTVPTALQVSIPATILLATCSVFGRMSADNEVVAIKSMGISPWVILAPGLGFALVVSVAAVWINDIAVSWGRTGAARVVLESVEEIAYNMLRTQRTYSTNSLSIHVKGVQGTKLLQPHISVRSKGKSPITITAREAELKSDTQENTLSILLTDSIAELGDDGIVDIPGEYERVIPLSEATRKGDNSNSPSRVELRRISSESNLQRLQSKAMEETMAVEAAFGMLGGDLVALQQSNWKTRYSKLADSKKRYTRLKLEPWRRWANGFSCFCFVLLGAPLSIRMRTSNFFTTFAAGFVPILLIYYPLLALAVKFGKSGDLPPYAVWMGNGVLALAGIWLMRRVIRY